ncbi:feruloyl esterase B [Coniochaeta sp. 2T2.1]|nr:feruloyl esterase B [Coniochaeta sp. 2T2.1]
MRLTHGLTALWATTSIHAATLQKIEADFPNPTNVGFYLYAPDKLSPNPPVLVSPHWCHGDALAVYNGSSFASLADRYGFIVIYPDSPNAADKCWDVSSKGTLSHQSGGGDSQGIVNMVAWTLKRYKADAGRVFVTGVSSGAMMTNVLLGAYPDVFAAGTAFAGVPFGCFAAPDGSRDYWNSDCATGLVQVFHGTADEVLNYTNFGEEVKQWTSVLGLCGSSTPAKTEENNPFQNWTKYVYGKDGWLEAYSALDVTHNIGNHEDVAMKWFDLTCTTGNCFRWGQGGPKGDSLLNQTPAF